VTTGGARGRVGLIVCVNPEGVIGKAGTIPWHYKGDFRRFKRVTMDSTVIMGRATWDSLPKKPLPGRRNVVITRRPLEGVETFASIPAALATTTGPVWFIGGARIYEEAMQHCDVLDVTYAPDAVSGEDVVRFPPIDPALFEAGPLLPHEEDPALTRREYLRRA
jgi:dihydrofolate reductase